MNGLWKLESQVQEEPILQETLGMTGNWTERRTDCIQRIANNPEKLPYLRVTMPWGEGMGGEEADRLPAAKRTPQT